MRYQLTAHRTAWLHTGLNDEKSIFPGELKAMSGL